MVAVELCIIFVFDQTLAIVELDLSLQQLVGCISDAKPTFQFPWPKALPKHLALRKKKGLVNACPMRNRWLSKLCVPKKGPNDISVMRKMPKSGERYYRRS